VFSRRGIAVSIALATLIGGVVVAPPVSIAAGTGPEPALSADLEGTPIAPTSVSSWYCHDLDYPRIHCFRTASAFAAAMSVRISPGRPGAAALSSTPYVIVYRDATYAGPFLSISQAYDNLASIGWNDMISSFKALNSLSGHFAVDASNGGSHYAFCCNNQVPYVGDAWNDVFSSVYPS